VIDAVVGQHVYELGQPLEQTMPTSPNHPGYRFALVRRHGDVMRRDGASASNELLVLGGHTGTHIDALAHVSENGRLHGGVDAAEAQRGGRFSALGIETVAPIVCRGVLLDVAGWRGVKTLPPAEPITSAHLAAVAETQGVTLPHRGAVLVRSGWSQLWSEPARYLGHESGVPGPDKGAAEWIAQASPIVTGHDTMAYEWLAPSSGHSVLPVHTFLLVDRGIYIIENLDLDALAADHVYEFLFVCLPLKFVGGTGSPIRPIAIAP
jgi:kynurenine formamidase